MKIIILSLMLGAISHSANAAPTYTKSYNACMDKAEGVTVEMLNCMEKETTAQDSALNIYFKAANKSLETAQKKKLLEAQRAWLKYRDANCSYYANPEGGTSASLDSSSCFLRMTAERTSELKSISN